MSPGNPPDLTALDIYDTFYDTLYLPCDVSYETPFNLLTLTIHSFIHSFSPVGEVIPAGGASAGTTPGSQGKGIKSIPSWLRRTNTSNGEVVVASAEMEGSDNWEQHLQNAYTDEPAPVTSGTKERPQQRKKKQQSTTTKPSI